MKKFLLVLLLAGLSHAQVLIPASSISVSTNGILISTNTLLQAYLEDIDAQISSNMVFIAAWENPTNGITQAAADDRYIGINALGSDFELNGGLLRIVNVSSNSVITSSISNNAVTFEKLGPNVSSNLFANPYQAYTYTAEISGTNYLSVSNGALISLTLTNDTWIGFEDDYSTGGVNRVSVDIYAGTNTMSIMTNSIVESFFNLSTNSITPLFFRKSGTNRWEVRQ